MHSHFGLQEQSLGTAPLILWTEEQQAKADEQYVVLLHDFSFKPASQILKELKAGMKKMKDMGGLKEMPKSETLVAQKWDDAGQRFVAASAAGELPDTDVKYDTLLANRCEQSWRLATSLPRPLSFSDGYVYGPEIRGSQYRFLATGEDAQRVYNYGTGALNLLCDRSRSRNDGLSLSR
jgi:hypothetical protein